MLHYQDYKNFLLLLQFLEKSLSDRNIIMWVISFICDHSAHFIIYSDMLRFLFSLYEPIYNKVNIERKMRIHESFNLRIETIVFW